MEFNFYSRYESGHRLDYINFCSQYMNGERVSFKNMLTRKEPLLFLMIEENFFLYVLISLFRILLKRKTSGLLFRGVECTRGNSLRLKIKKNVLILLKYFENSKTISIIPFYLDRNLSDICDDWIYDFQFWDKEYLESQCNKLEVSRHEHEIKRIAAGRKIVSAIGKQDVNKGFDKFIEMSKKNNEKLLFISAGKISDNCRHFINDIDDKNILFIDSFISNNQLVALYRSSDFIWNLYSPQYDQSSGVFGRTLQYKNKPIIRKGSVLEKIALAEKLDHISLEYNEIINTNLASGVNSLSTHQHFFENKQSSTFLDICF
ncbi:hypothetical protein ACXJY6_14640 [Vibrio sp. RC27]